MRFVLQFAAAFSLSLMVFMPAPSCAAGDAGGAGGAGAGVTGSLVEILHDKGVIDDASYDELKAEGAKGGESAQSGRLIEILHDKGVIDDASYVKLTGKSLAAAGETPVSEPESSPAAAPRGGGEPAVRDVVKPLDRGLSAIEDGIAKLGRDNVSMKISFFFQGGWVSDSGDFSAGTPPTTDIGSSNQFFVRRARMYFSGKVLEKIGYKVSFETASSKILRDAFVYVDYIPRARLTVGQFKVPFGLEGVEALAINPTVNRSLVTNFVHAPTLRDRGLTASGSYDTEISGLPFGVMYYAGVFNGNGFNTSDDNSEKDVVARLRVKPGVAGLNVGGSWYKGMTHHSPAAVFDKDRDQWAAELDYDPPYARGLKLRAEYIWARKYFDSFASSAASPLPAFGRHAHTDGWYALAAYRVDGLQGLWRYLNGLEPVVRYDFLDEDTAVSDDERHRTTVGLNYYLARDTRIMANYEFIRADGRLRKNSLEIIDTDSHELFTALLQLKF